VVLHQYSRIEKAIEKIFSDYEIFEIVPNVNIFLLKDIPVVYLLPLLN